MIDTDMIKALRCLASQDAEGNCYEDIYNFGNRDKQQISCGGSLDGTVPCPYYQNKYEVCFEDGECGEWLNALADELEKIIKPEKEESGKRGESIKFPCVTGTTVYVLWNETGEKYMVYRAVLKEIRLGKYMARSNIKYLIETTSFRGRMMIFCDDDFGRRVFFSREEAEHALKEMKCK